jgi:hypothetical protein
MATEIKLTLNYKKAGQLATIFQLLKACSEMVAIIIKPDYVYIQVMDKSHICLCESRLYKQWFQEVAGFPNVVAGTTKTKKSSGSPHGHGRASYPTFSFSAGIFHTIIGSVNSPDQTLQITFDTGADTFKIDIIHAVTNKENINKHYTLPLTSLEHEFMDIPETDYNVDFSIGVKTINDIFMQMGIFGTGIRITCDEENVKISSTGDNANGNMDVKISTADFDEYSIVEDAQIDLKYSLSHIMKFCITTKLVPNVLFNISPESPMKISYLLDETTGTGTPDKDNSTDPTADADADDENKACSCVQFFIAPKVDSGDDE